MSDKNHITYIDMLNRLNDMERLAVYSDERCFEASSYEKLSKYDEINDCYIDWGANNDDGYDLPQDVDGGYIFADIKGSGALVRIWSAYPKNGHIKIFIDDEKVPVVDFPFISLFENDTPPFSYSQFCYDASRGKNCYVPITFNKSCKVRAYGDWGRYYQINYIKFPENTTVEPFKLPLTTQQQKTFSNINRKFEQDIPNAVKATSENFCTINETTHSKQSSETSVTSSQHNFSDSGNLCTINETTHSKQPSETSVAPSRHKFPETSFNAVTILGNKSITIFEQYSPGAITQIKAKINNLQNPGDDWDALSQLTIAAYWDGEEKPSVWSTLGGFFASITGLSQSKTLAAGVTENGTLYANWYMPFENGAEFIIKNNSNTPYSISFEITTVPLTTQKASELLRFHAKWTKLADPVKNDRWPDSLLLSVDGKGRFVGTSMHIYKKIGTGDPEYHPDWWWGEGDEKFFVDNEKFPSWFGTGSEDYFGYAWGSWQTFAKPYHSQPFTNGGMWGIGNRLNNRFHIMDSVPFGEKFEAYIEKYHRDEFSNQVCTNFWYAEKNRIDNYCPVSLNERTNYYEKPYQKPSLYYDGESIIILDTTGMMKAETQKMIDFDGNWTNNSQLIFTAEEKNATMNLRINIPQNGNYNVSAAFTKANDYGIVQHYIDDMPIGEQIDLYNEQVINSGEISLGKINLKQSYHKLTIIMTGKNLNSKNYFYGLDYIRFTISNK